MKDLIQIASAEIGVKEVSGSEHNSRIIEYAKEAGFDWVNDDETPWCSIFVNWCAQKAELASSKKASARSWLTVGQKVSNPEPGDVVVFWRGSRDSWKGHVAIYMGYSKDGTRVYCLGGNQGNQVSITGYSADKLLGFRRLGGASQIVSVPQSFMKKGSSGNDVKTLQTMLNVKGFDCGVPDGIFGADTEQAVKDLQAASGYLTIDGLFGKNAASYLQEIMGE